uniref:Uncharacterized protein n=1 Tax=Lepeophtheirus salmonis TaxID=72036 RepID=A0A0K2T1X5_LEPSM
MIQCKISHPNFLLVSHYPPKHSKMAIPFESIHLFLYGLMQGLLSLSSHHLVFHRQLPRLLHLHFQMESN